MIDMDVLSAIILQPEILIGNNIEHYLSFKINLTFDLLCPLNLSRRNMV